MKWVPMLFLSLASGIAMAQSPELRVSPTMEPAGGSFENRVKVGCTFPEGCKGIYFMNGVEIQAKDYTDSIVIDRSLTLSVAGVNSEGRIITDVVSHSFEVTKVAAPSVSVDPAEGVRQSSFYVTKLQWENALRVELDLSQYKTLGCAHYGEPVVWLTDAAGTTLAQGDYNAIWENGLNAFKVYLYKNYKQPVGHYTLHVAGNIFMIDGERYAHPLSFQYEVQDASAAPYFTPASGTYMGPLTVSISYPTDGTAFYAFYSINGGTVQSYTAPLVLEESAVIEAYGVNEDFDKQTPHTTASYVITKPTVIDSLQVPVVRRSGNTLTLSSQEGATIKYWLNDRMQQAAHYSAPLTVTENLKLSCLAYDGTRQSRVVDYFVKDLPADRGELGDIVLKTPFDVEEMHIQSLSPNGRFAVGYTGQSESSRGFIWDLSADIITYPTRAYINQLLSISDEGVAYGWCANSVHSDEVTSEEELLWGTCYKGVWTPNPEGMEVNGITADGRLYGSMNGSPAFYDITTLRFDILQGQGSIVCVGRDKAAGYSGTGANRIPTVWSGGEAHSYSQLSGSINAISDNGEWALVGETQRLHLTDGKVEEIISTSYLYPNQRCPELLRGILDDGTLYATYDDTFLSPDKGLAVVYTPDRRWRTLSNWMTEALGYTLEDYDITSARAILGPGNQLLLHILSQNNLADEPFTRAASIQLNAQVRHLAPNAVQATQQIGKVSVLVSWNKPLFNAVDVKAYQIVRNGTLLATVSAGRYEYIDETVEEEVSYTYAVRAQYSDGVVSDPSYPSSIICHANDHYPVRNLRMRQVGLNSVKLDWQSPLSALPRLQYFDDEAESFAFGVPSYDSEWAVRIPASSLSNYSGQQIRTFHFLPTGQQLGYELRLYTGSSSSSDYNHTPFYSQTIAPESLQYGTVNTIQLSEPQDVPAGADLYVALYVHSAGNGDILGIQYEGFRRGYTDLCRVINVHSDFISIADESSVSTEIVLPLGVGICTEAELLSGQVDHYIVTESNDTLHTQSLSALFEHIEPGEHLYRVHALYRDQVMSGSQSIPVMMVPNEAAFVPVEEIQVSVDADRKGHFHWQAPQDDDRTLIHWGDLTPSAGLPMPESLDFFVAASIYPNTLLADYGSDYEITALYFYPTSDALFALVLDDANNDGETVFAVTEPQTYTTDRLTYVKLDEPVRIDPSVNYRLSIDVFEAPADEAPLAYDSSNRWRDGFSNIIMYAGTVATLSDIVQIGEHPNWLMGLQIRRCDAPELPVTGYQLKLDQMPQHETLLQSPEWHTTAPLNKSNYLVSVDVTYSNGKLVQGVPVFFDVSEAMGIESLDATDMAEGVGKILRDGRIMVRRQGVIYNLYGTQIAE